MCGIVGYVGNNKSVPVLINGLLKLEYRGYDSAGIATIQNNNISIIKDKGRVANLQSNSELQTINSTCGIAHTRWATHGKPSRENAHPHLDCFGNFAAVHNGIIENYQEIKNFLIQNGYTFQSETDTEVIPNLVDYYFVKDPSGNNELNFLKAVKDACNDFRGSYAIEVISKYCPDKIIIVRKNSPLIVGTTRIANYVASDIPAILEYTNSFYFLDDDDFAIISKDNVRFFNSELQEHKKALQIINLSVENINKNGFEDYMLKEIHEEPDSIKATISPKFEGSNVCNFNELDFSKEFLNSINHICIVACGTAMHAGLCSKVSFETLCNIPTTVEVASEFRYRNPLIDSHTLCIFVSQSGETADTIAALKLAKSKGCKTITITNVLNSSITREADFSVYTYAGPEIAVASTKAYTSQVAILNCLAIYFSEILEIKSREELVELKEEINKLPSKIDMILSDSYKIESLAKKIYKEKNIFFLGRGIDYTTSLEGSLKLKEITYIHSEAYPAGELKHGPIALIEDNTTIICTITDENLIEKTISNLKETISRGAKVIVITNLDVGEITKKEHIITIPSTATILSPTLSIIPLQLLSYNIAKLKGLDVDKPRNLAKSVTVE